MVFGIIIRRSGGSGHGGDGHGNPEAAEVDNIRFATYTMLYLASVVVALLVYRVVLGSNRYIRSLACLNNDTQRYFMQPNSWFGFLKNHLIYAPLFRTRHARDMNLLKGWSVGVLPTRLQSLFLGGVITMNIVLCTKGIEWTEAGSETMLNHLRNRSGTLAVVNMIPLAIAAGRNNPLISMLGMSYDTFNLIHRWLGRIVVAETITHMVCWAVKAVHKGGWESIGKALQSSQTIITGFIGAVAFVFILFQATTLVRHAFYELFLHLHITLVILALVALWFHLDGLQQKVYLQIVIAAWAAERAVRLLTLIYRNVGAGNNTKAILEPLPGDAVRVTIYLARPWKFRAGQHVFITLPAIGLWMGHPFSVAWSEELEEDRILDPEKALAQSRHPVLGFAKTSMSAIVRRRDGFTSKVFQKAEAASSPEGAPTTLTAFVEGPYGGMQSLHSYGSVVLFAGGVGITHQLPYVRDLVTGFANGTIAARRVLLVWVIQSPEHLQWIRPWMTDLLALHRRREILRIQLFVSRPRTPKEIVSPSTTVQMFPGRPNVDTIIDMEVSHQVGAMAVSVCGPGGLADDVRRATRKRVNTNVDFIEENFSW